jgi:menaquinone-dependent protoporphyrinogen oxidase
VSGRPDTSPTRRPSGAGHETACTRILVAYASAHGSTRRIADEIAAPLVRAGATVEVLPVDDVRSSPDSYDACIVGSAVHGMEWLPAAIAFVEQHAASLATRPVWLFSVSSVGDTTSVFGPRVAGLMRRLRSEPKTIPRLRTVVHPLGHRNFAGVIERSHWDLAGHLFLRAFGGRYGDHLDHEDIARWADAVAARVASERRNRDRSAEPD